MGSRRVRQDLVSEQQEVCLQGSREQSILQLGGAAQRRKEALMLFPHCRGAPEAALRARVDVMSPQNTGLP